MSPQPQHPARNLAPAPPDGRKGPLRLLARTLQKAWEGNLFSEAAEAAFWQTLSLPPLLLGLLGSLGYIAEWFGPDTIQEVHDKILDFTRTTFSPSVVNGIIDPTVSDILTKGRGEILTLGFVISLWAGSSAMSSFVDAITVAHDQYGVRNEVWQRFFALLLYIASLIVLVIGLPALAIGPDLLPNFFPVSWRPRLTDLVDILYYPVVALLSVVALATLYKLALPRKLPWHRGLPGAVLAMLVFLLSSIGLRLYISLITKTGYTYGALATPIAFLLFLFFIGLAIVIGAYFNSAIQEMWPARMTRRQRRRWRRLEIARQAEQIRAEADEQVTPAEPGPTEPRPTEPAPAEPKAASPELDSAELDQAEVDGAELDGAVQPVDRLRLAGHGEPVPAEKGDQSSPPPGGMAS